MLKYYLLLLNGKPYEYIFCTEQDAWEEADKFNLEAEVMEVIVAT